MKKKKFIKKIRLSAKYQKSLTRKTERERHIQRPTETILEAVGLKENKKVSLVNYTSKNS